MDADCLIVQLLSFPLQDTVETAGAEVSEEGIIETFRNDDEALDATDNGVVVSILFSYIGLLLCC